MHRNLSDIWRKYQDAGVFYRLDGPVTQDLLAEICDTVAQRMRLDDAEPSTEIKVQAAIVELSQNIVRYSAARTDGPDNGGGELGLGIIAVACHNMRYVVTGGNLIENHRIPPLEGLLTRLRGMGREELRHFFLEQRKSAPPDGSKGAGLGFIDLSRKAAEPIEFEFRPVDDEVSFFCIKIAV